MKNSTLVACQCCDPTSDWHPITPCLVLHHPLSGTPPASGITPLSGTPPSLSGIPPPCLEAHLCLVSHPMTGIPPLSGTPSFVCNPTLARTPSLVWYPTPVPHSTILPSAPPHLALAVKNWPLMFCPLPPNLAPGYLFSNSCPLPPSSCLHHPQQLPSGLPAPCHPLPPLPSGPHCPCLIWLSAILPPAHHHIPSSPPTPPPHPQPGSHVPTPPTKYHHQKSSQPKKEILRFSEFLSFLVFISILPCMGSIPPHVLPSTQK